AVDVIISREVAAKMNPPPWKASRIDAFMSTLAVQNSRALCTRHANSTDCELPPRSYRRTDCPCRPRPPPSPHTHPRSPLLRPPPHPHPSPPGARTRHPKIRPQYGTPLGLASIYLPGFRIARSTRAGPYNGQPACFRIRLPDTLAALSAHVEVAGPGQRVGQI